MRSTVPLIHLPKATCAALAVMALLVGGCAHFEPKSLDVAQTAGDFDARTLDTPELRAFIETNLGPVSAWPVVQWNFEQLTMAALFLHARLDEARAELASVRASEITAGARPNPTVSLTPEYNFNPASGVSPWIATIQFDLPIETAGKRGHRITKARQLGEAARLRLGGVAWEVRSAVRLALLDLHDAGQRAELLSRQLALQARIIGEVDRALAVWQGAQSRLEAMKEVRAAQESRVKSLQAQFDAGAVESLDVLTAEAELAGDELFHWEAHVKALRAFGELEDGIQFPLPLDLSLNPRRSEP